MAEMNVNNSARHMTIRHRGRGAQVWIYLGKMLRMFVYQNDWKVLPMAALIAGLVGMVYTILGYIGLVFAFCVIRKRLQQSRETRDNSTDPGAAN